jgi:hypothetical protein
MKTALFVLGLLLFTFSPAFAQQQIDAATREDIEQMLQLMGSRHQIQQMWTGMAQQAASLTAEAYQRKHPDATPLEIRKAAELAGEQIQKTISVFSVDELFDAMIPIYQRHLTHSEVRAVIAFYETPVGQKILNETPAISAESMQAIQPILRKHMPELEAQAEAAAAKAAKESPDQSK